MGSSTPHLNLYKPDGTELVDVVEQLNENYDKLDTGILSLDSRVETVEGIAGITSWEAWTPTIRSIDLAFANTIDHADYFKIGGLVFCDVQTVKTAVNATHVPATDASSIRISLPYEMQNSFVVGALTLSVPTASPVFDYIFLPERWSATDVNFAIPSENAFRFPQPPLSYVYQQNAVLKFSFQYRTNGVAVP